MMKNPIHIVRPINLAMIAITMIVLLFKYKDESMDSYWFRAILLILPAVLTAAAGYVVNDIYDVKTDSVNKPESVIIGNSMTAVNAWILYALLNLLSLGLSFFFSRQFFIVNISIIAMLYLYAIQLKGTPLIGNIIVALCSAAVIACCILLVKFESEPGFVNFTGYIIFAFIISMIRELVKDMQDIEGDKVAELKTYPIVAGIKGGKIIVYSFCGIEIILCGLYSFLAFGLDYYISSIIMGLVTLSLFYFINAIAVAKTKEDFGKASKFLKYIMFAGVLNIPFS